MEDIRVLYEGYDAPATGSIFGDLFRTYNPPPVNAPVVASTHAPIDYVVRFPSAADIGLLGKGAGEFLAIPAGKVKEAASKVKEAATGLWDSVTGVFGGLKWSLLIAAVVIIVILVAGTRFLKAVEG